MRPVLLVTLIFLFFSNSHSTLLPEQNKIAPVQDSLSTIAKSLGIINGRVIDKITKEPLAGVNISINGKRRGTITDPNGDFSISIQSGEYTLIFDYMGYGRIGLESIVVAKGKDINLNIEMSEQPIPLQEIVVTPGSYSIMGDVPSMQQTLNSEDIKIMGWAEDITRAVQRIPGISANDFSAKFNIRGGDADEVLVLLDGMQIYQPFHQKDFGGGLFSTIDIETISSVNLMTGGFTADYGDRMSGVLNMTTKSPKESEHKTSVGISLMNARAFSMGTFNDNNGSWLFSVRRGYLDLINKLMNNEFKLEPEYYDIFGKVSYKLSGIHTLAANVFIANDAYKLDDKEMEPGKSVPNVDYVDTQYGNEYGWFNLKSAFSDELFAQTLLYGGSVTKKRFWDRYDDDPNASLTVATLSDDRDFSLFGVKQDWNWQATKNIFVKLGIDYKRLNVNYDYSNDISYEYVSADDSLRLYAGSYEARKKEKGTQFGFYLSGRFHLTPPLVIESGVRYDNASYANDKLWSPRLNLVYSFDKTSFLRAGWGYYYQSQGIDQLNIQYGETSFRSAQMTKQYVLGFEHYFSNGLYLRTEGYYKNISNLRDAYYTFANIDEFFPEAREDLFRVSFNKAITKGIEILLKYDTHDKFSWWLSYVLSEAKEDYKDIQFAGKFTKELGLQSRPWDQRHTINADVNYRLNKNWHFSLSWQYRSGWPYTPFEVKRKPRPDGTYSYYHEYGMFNGATYPDYHRLDMRVNRYFYPGSNKITVFLHIINLYDQENISSYDHDIVNPYSDDYKVKIVKESWFGFTPFAGINWEF